jgi:hypothetical protein
MRKLALLALAVFSLPVARGESIIYGDSFEEFVARRDLIFSGVVTSIDELEDGTQPTPVQVGPDEEKLPDQIAKIRIVAVLKNQRKIEGIEEDSEIRLIVPNVQSWSGFGGIVRHKVGMRGFWILDSSKPNYGLDSSRATVGLHWEQRIREALK